MAYFRIWTKDRTTKRDFQLLAEEVSDQLNLMVVTKQHFNTYSFSIKKNMSTIFGTEYMSVRECYIALQSFYKTYQLCNELEKET